MKIQKMTRKAFKTQYLENQREFKQTEMCFFSLNISQNVGLKFIYQSSPVSENKSLTAN